MYASWLTVAKTFFTSQHAVYIVYEYNLAQKLHGIAKMPNSRGVIPCLNIFDPNLKHFFLDALKPVLPWAIYIFYIKSAQETKRKILFIQYAFMSDKNSIDYQSSIIGYTVYINIGVLGSVQAFSCKLWGGKVLSQILHRPLNLYIQVLTAVHSVSYLVNMFPRINMLCHTDSIFCSVAE